jgi:protein gp37
VIESGISWTRYAKSALWGCTSCSAGCRLCYAARRTYRFGKTLPAYAGLAKKDSNGKFAFTGVVRYLPHHFNALFQVKEPSLFFLNEFSDILHESLPIWIPLEHVTVAGQAHWHEIRLLTKRHQRLAELDAAVTAKHVSWPENLWMGLSVCEAGELEKIASVQGIGAGIRWLSVEPWLSDPNRPLRQSHPNLRERLRGIHWVVIGGESASRFRARVMTMDDLRYWIEESRAAGCAVWVKQLGSALAFQLGVAGRKKNGEKGNAIAGAIKARWPRDVQIQENPETPERRSYDPGAGMRFKSGVIAWQSDAAAQNDSLVQIQPVV